MRFTKILATVTTAAVLGTAGVSIAGAATSGSSSTTAPAAKAASGEKAEAAHPRWRVRRIVVRALGLSAKTINIPRADLVKELRAGKTVGEVATAHGVQPKTVIDALVKAGQEKLDAAKAAGKLDDDRYAQLEQRLPKVAARFVNTWHLKAKAA